MLLTSVMQVEAAGGPGEAVDDHFEVDSLKILIPVMISSMKDAHHVNQVPGGDPAQCPVCGVSLPKKKYNRDRHLKQHEESDKVYTCDLPCKYSTNSKSHFERHQGSAECIRFIDLK